MARLVQPAHLRVLKHSQETGKNGKIKIGRNKIYIPIKVLNKIAKNMNIQQVLNELKTAYPKTNIVFNNRDNPTEIVCEVEPTSEHRNHSIAVAIIDKSKPHYHNVSTELYEVIRGRLTVIKDGKSYFLKEGDMLTVKPGEIHHAEGNETRVKVTSKPGWKFRDHHLILDVPYISAPKNACALACYTMIAKYFFPEITFNQIAKISGWKQGYVVWAFKFWQWIMDKGVKVEDCDLIALQTWADEGIEGLKKSVSEKEFRFYQKNTKDLDKLTEDIRKVMRHKNFTYHQQKPKFSDLVAVYNKGYVCEAVLDSRTLDGKKGFSLHRVVILDVNGKDIVFHDPREKPRPARKESIKLFCKAWLEAVSEPELCVYKKV